MKLKSSLIFLTVLIASGLCEDTTATSTPTSVQTTTITDTSASISEQPNITTVYPNTTTSQQPNITTVSPNTTTSQQPNTTTVSSSTTAQQLNTTIASTTTTTTNLPTSVSTEPSTTNDTTSSITVNPTTSTTTVNPTTSTTVNPTTSTTVNPTSTSLPDTTTTIKPTSLPPITTTKSPEPPTPVEGSWNVSESNLTCIRADLTVRFRISVMDHEEYIVLNPNATSSGSCKSSNSTQELQLEETKYTLTMIFEKDSENAYLKNITFTYTLPDSSGTFYNDNKLFTVKIGNSYLCDSSDNIDLKNVSMEIFRIHIQSFGSAESKDFGTAEECEADFKDKKDKVAPAVGIVLLVLVVVVLVAYFVERRRSQQKGYQTV